MKRILKKLIIKFSSIKKSTLNLFSQKSNLGCKNKFGNDINRDCDLFSAILMLSMIAIIIVIMKIMY